MSGVSLGQLPLVGSDETCPLPRDPVLAATAAALTEAGQWAEIFDPGWRSIYITDEARWMYGGRVELAPFPLGAHFCGPETVSTAMEWRGGQFPLEIHRRFLAQYGPWFMVDAPGGREELRALVDPRLADMLDDLEPVAV